MNAASRSGVPNQSPAFGRFPFLDFSPTAPAPFLPKAYAGEVIPFAVTTFREGHDLIGVELVLTSPSGASSVRRMRLWPDADDRYTANAAMRETGIWTWRIVAWADEWRTWQRVAAIKLPAGQDVPVTLAIGAAIVRRASNETERTAEARDLLATAARRGGDRRVSPAKRLAALQDPAVRAELAEHPLRSLTTPSAEQRLRVERERAGVGAWYEFFPRSEGAVRRKDGSWKSGTFKTAQQRLPAIAAMGFDVVYVPPVHPIGERFRKGRNNALEAAPGDPGSPWAIGGPAGGHDAIHPDLGTEKDFAAFVKAVEKAGLELAIDLALQASPDHPWLTEHPEWFTTLPDGTIAYAENPPKKYQDIYPLNFDNDPEGLREEILRIVELWIDRGVRIFRVDNPHTKPVGFWAWLLSTVNAEHPDVVFLAEAFTRPAPMEALALAGFQQSYTYFPWKNTRPELVEFLESVTRGSEAPRWEPHGTADILRPSLWVNTPDILSEYLQFGGRGAFKIRAAVAAFAAPLWGVYSGYELIEQVARPGADEAIDNEKYEYKPRDWAAAEASGQSIAGYLTLLNRIRHERPALRQLRNLRFHWSDDERVLVFSKHLDAEFTGTSLPDRLVIVANLDPYSVVETRVHVDPRMFGMASDAVMTAQDLITGEVRPWFTADNAVRLDPWNDPVQVWAITETPGDSGDGGGA